MNTLEDRVRQALAQRAEHSPISTGAWDRALAASGRPLAPRLSWPRRLPAGLLIPAAAAVAVVAVVLASLALASRAPGADVGTSPASGSSGPVPARVLRSKPAFTAIIPVTAGSATIYFWYTDRKNPQLCTFVKPAAAAGRLASCAFLRVAPGQPIAFQVDRFGSLYYGVATARFISVSVLLAKSGKTIPGRVVSGRGFPDRAWAVADPGTASGWLVFRNATGHEVMVSYEAGPAPRRR